MQGLGYDSHEIQLVNSPSAFSSILVRLGRRPQPLTAYSIADERKKLYFTGAQA